MGERADLIAELPGGDAFAQSHDLACDFKARQVRSAGRRGIAALALCDVSGVQACVADGDEDVDALLAPRIVTMDTARVASYAPPAVTLEVEVGKGFYVRSLVRDLGETLGTAAHVTSLRRTRIGPFSDSEAIALEDVTEESGLPWLAALERVLPELSVSETVAKRLSFGQRIGGQDLARIPERGEPQLARFEGEPVAVVSWDGERLTIVRGLAG
jgi:tRNA U55 pseudouridine synthase TruB